MQTFKTLMRPAIGGFAFWGILVNYRPIPHGLIFIHLVFGMIAAFFLGALLARRFRGDWAEGSWLWAAAVGYVAVAVGVNCNVLFFYLLSTVYYPFPRPDYADLRVFLTYSAPVVLAAVFAAQGGRAFDFLQRSADRRREAALGVFGFGLGLFAANVVGAFSWVAALFAALALLALIAARSRAAIVASLVLVAAAFGLHLRQPDLVYLGSLQDATLEAKIDSPYTRTHIYTFADRRCVALASTFHAITYNCAEPGRLPRGLSYLFRALVGELPSYRALVVGRTLGMYPNLLLATNPNAQLIQTAEFDPMQAAAVERTFDPLTVAPDARGRIRYFAGDLARFVLAQREKYDIVFYNGVGLSQYPIPFALPYHEQSLFTTKVFDHLFADVLDPHGALVFDWGGRTDEEQAFIRATLPKDVHSAAFWYVLTDPPFTGTPLTYVVASRDPTLIAKVRDHAARASFFRELPDPTGEATARRPLPWNRPVLRPQIAGLQLAGLLLIFAVFAVGLFALRFRPTLLWPTGATLPAWLAGAMAMAWFVDAAARHGRQLIGYGYAWPIMALSLFTAFAVGLRAPTRWWERTSGKLALSLGVLAAAAVSVADLTGPLAAAGVALAGLLCGVGWGIALDAGGRTAFPALLGGATFGLALDQAALFFVGFDGGVAWAGLFALILIWSLRVQRGGLADA